MNQAQQLLASIGVAAITDKKQAHGGKNASATKAGSGRYPKSGAAGNRLTKQKPLRAYRALMRHFAGKRTGDYSLV
jgi:hypothetical protein